MQFRVIRYYHAGNVEYQAGQIIALDDLEYAAWLLRDANGGIVPYHPEPPVERAVETPPQDRMMRARKRRKA